MIRDTVARAQHAYQLIQQELAEELDADVTLAHSRFLAFDRVVFACIVVAKEGGIDARHSII